MCVLLLINTVVCKYRITQYFKCELQLIKMQILNMNVPRTSYILKLKKVKTIAEGHNNNKVPGMHIQHKNPTIY